MMNAQNCLQMLREIRDCCFATVNEQGFPENRMIDVMLVREEELLFCTARGKNFYRQLTTNGNVAIAGMNDRWQTVRLTGTANRIEDAAQKETIDLIFENNPSMNGVYPGESRYILEAFSVSSGNLEFFDLGVSPIERHSFTFGDAAAEEKGFCIGDDCIECGTCKDGCPQQCIDEGSPYRIRQENCLHCGLCHENCPVEAIERLG